MDSEESRSAQTINAKNLTIETLSPHLAEQVLDIQTKEIALRQHELEAKKQEDKNRHEFAKAALQVKAADLVNERQHERWIQAARFIFLGIVILVVAGVITYALAIGKDGFAMEIIKAVIFLLSGGIGGFAMGKSSSGGRDKTSSHRDSLE